MISYILYHFISHVDSYQQISLKPYLIGKQWFVGHSPITKNEGLHNSSWTRVRFPFLKTLLYYGVPGDIHCDRISFSFR